MIKYLNRLKCRKGFTIVELIVVIAIIAVLTAALLVNLIGGNTDKILAANANAEAFFPACQLAFTRAQLTERDLVTYTEEDVSSGKVFIEYKDGKNQIPDGNYLFVEAKFQQSGMVGLHINFTLNELMARDDFTTDMTDLEKYFAKNISEYLADSYDGYFYGLIDNDFKVTYTHYCDYRFPTWNGTDVYDTFCDSLMLTSDGKLKGNHGILGTCADAMPTTGSYVFDLPGSSSDHSKYFKS